MNDNKKLKEQENVSSSNEICCTKEKEGIELFFREWSNAKECQQKYESRVVELTEEMIKIQGQNYNPTFHDKIIRELARHEIMCQHYEYLIANNMESSPNIGILLKNQWTQLNKCRDLLGLGAKAVAVTNKSKEVDNGGMNAKAKEALFNMLQQAKESGDI